MSLKAIDLFAGAGGLSCGFLQAGFSIPLAVERDQWASETYSYNHPHTCVITQNITEVPNEIFEKYSGADVVMGGPPCQGFSISASNRRKLDDPRNLLYLELIRAVAVIRPRAVLIENVKEITRFRLPTGELLVDDIKQKLFAIGYESIVINLNALFFGVPQSRHRVFIIAAKEKSKLKRIEEDLSGMCFTSRDVFTKNKTHAENFVSLWDALSDLPEVQPWKVAEDAVQPYTAMPITKYQIQLRSNASEIHNHVPMRHTPRMVERFSHLIKNSMAHLPDSLAPRSRGNPELSSGKVYDQNHRLLDPNKPAPTITASFYSSFIHPFQPRNLTVREAARLQSFPDSFVFKGKRTTLSKKLLAKKGVHEDLHLDQFNQVGNSVPPLLAKILAEKIMKLM